MEVPCFQLVLHARIKRWGSPHPLKNDNSIRFLSNDGPDPLKIHKAIKPAFKVGPSLAHQRNAIKMEFRWQANDDPLLVVFGSPLTSSTEKAHTKKNVFRVVGPPQTKRFGSAHEC